MRGRIIDKSLSKTNAFIVQGENIGGAGFSLNNIKEHLVNGNSIEIRGFGTFEVVYRRGILNPHNPKTGELLDKQDGYFTVRFRPGKILNKLISSQEYDLKP